MKLRRILGTVPSLAILAACAALMGAAPSYARTVKVGIILPYSGPEADLGRGIDRGIELYRKVHPTVPGGNKLELIKRDSTGPNPAVAKRLAQELITRDRVDVIAGIVFSNNAFAIMGLCTQAKTPVLILNAGTASLTTKCPYVARDSFTMWQSAYPLGKYAYDHMGIKTAALAFANYAPGKDSVNAFKASFTKAGGKIVADIPLPFPSMPDFTPFLQRVKDAKPDALYVFVPSGNWATNLMKTFGDLGMAKAGIKLIGPGDITPDTQLPNMGKVPLGVMTMFDYSAAHNSAENRKFVAEWKKTYGKNTTPDFLGVQGWDGMAALYHVIARTGGKITGKSFDKAIEGWHYESPRGPILIDPKTRDIVQNEYLRKVEMRDGHLANVELKTIKMVRDPWKKIHHVD